MVAFTRVFAAAAMAIPFAFAAPVPTKPMELALLNFIPRANTTISPTLAGEDILYNVHTKRADVSKTWEDATDTEKKNLISNIGNQVKKDVEDAGESLDMSDDWWAELLAEPELQQALYDLLKAGDIFSQVDYLWKAIEAVECKLQKAGTITKAPRGDCK